MTRGVGCFPGRSRTRTRYWSLPARRGGVFGFSLGWRDRWGSFSGFRRVQVRSGPPAGHQSVIPPPAGRKKLLSIPVVGLCASFATPWTVRRVARPMERDTVCHAATIATRPGAAARVGPAAGLHPGMTTSGRLAVHNIPARRLPDRTEASAMPKWTRAASVDMMRVKHGTVRCDLELVLGAHRNSGKLLFDGA